MKAIVNFLLLAWHLSSNRVNLLNANLLMISLSGSISDVVNESSVRCLRMQNRLLFPSARLEKSNHDLDEKHEQKKYVIGNR